MNCFPKGFGGHRQPPEEIKRAAWQDEGVLVVSDGDPRLTWPERELVRQLGRKLYGAGPAREASHG